MTTVADQVATKAVATKLFRTKKRKSPVWIVVGARLPKKSFLHTTKPSALTEAQRLAEAYPEQTFNVAKLETEYFTRKLRSVT